MHEETDLFDSALQALQAREWNRENHKKQLEEKLMREFNVRPASRRFGRHPLLLATLAVLVVGSMGFAATGGIALVKDWFVTVYINGKAIDSDVTDYYEDDDGTAHMILDMGAAGEAQLEIFSEKDSQVSTINVTAGLCPEVAKDGVVEFAIETEQCKPDDE